jgi:quercetin dioxygenase-like cupin family protein
MEDTATMTAQPTALILTPVESYFLLGESVDIVVTGEMTQNKTSMIIETSPPSGGPPPHIHKNCDEILTVIDGAFEVLCGNKWQHIKTGEMAFIPRGALHTFRNAGDAPGRVAASFFPSGMEKFFADFANGLTSENILSKLMEAGDRHKTQFFLDPPRE